MSIISQYAIPLLQNSLQLHITSNSIVDQLVVYLKAIPEIGNLKNDLELLLHAMKIIEVLVKNDPTCVIDKKAVLLAAMRQVHPEMTDYDVNIVTNGISFICNANLITIEKVEKTILQYISTPLRSLYKKFIRVILYLHQPRPQIRLLEG